jgi:hypothetical protein
VIAVKEKYPLRKPQMETNPRKLRAIRIEYKNHIFLDGQLSLYFREKTFDRLKKLFDTARSGEKLSGEVKDWLRGKTDDPDTGIRSNARMVYDMWFPHEEEKAGLKIHSLEFSIRGTVRSDREILYGIPVNIRFFADDTGLVRFINYDGKKNNREGEVIVGPQAASEFLNDVIWELNAPFWDEDELDREVVPSLRSVRHPSDRKGKPAVYLRLVMNRGGEKVIEFYRSIPRPAQALLEWLIYLVAGDGDTACDASKEELRALAPKAQ